MAEQYCNRTLEEFLQLARYRETFFFSLCFKLRVFSPDKSWKYFSNSRLIQSFVNTSQRQEPVP